MRPSTRRASMRSIFRRCSSGSSREFITNAEYPTSAEAGSSLFLGFVFASSSGLRNGTARSPPPSATSAAAGRITEISHLPSQDLFIVERPDGTELMIPFVEEIVTEIDLEEQRAVISPPPGLIDGQAEVASSREES